jgi:hypothetical protein
MDMSVDALYMAKKDKAELKQDQLRLPGLDHAKSALLNSLT